MMQVRTGLGIDSHRFVEGDSDRPLVLGGLVFDDAPALAGNSDADVLLHALTDAISGVTGRTVIGAVADALCQDGVTDSKVYLQEALKDLGSWAISHVSIVFECKYPKIDPKVPSLKRSLCKLLSIDESALAITATSGEELNGVGRGDGIRVHVIVTATK